jgi:hypothetical protein
VLVVDDTKVNRRLMSHQLRRRFDERIDVATAEDGDRAIECIKEDHERIACVFLDLHMPTSGYTVVRTVRAWERERGLRRVKIIALTANVMEETKERCRAEGMDGYATKPLPTEMMHDFVETAIQNVAA